MNSKQNENKAIILFDGVCNLCSKAVQIIIKNDANDYFRFASLQSDTGIALLAQYHLPISSSPESIVLIEDGSTHQLSSAALRIAKRLSGGYRFLYFFIIVPSFIRNWVYRFIARNRYRWWGKQDDCWLPTPELKAKFL
jgi:predicted DCC family thiol-disulfide oxidoreductase YuxK